MDLIPAVAANEIMAMARAASDLPLRPRTIIGLGGQISKWILSLSIGRTRRISQFENLQLDLLEFFQQLDAAVIDIILNQKDCPEKKPETGGNPEPYSRERVRPEASHDHEDCCHSYDEKPHPGYHVFLATQSRFLPFQHGVNLLSVLIQLPGWG
jgi:hypothetical protein